MGGGRQHMIKMGCYQCGWKGHYSKNVPVILVLMEILLQKTMSSIPCATKECKIVVCGRLIPQVNDSDHKAFDRGVKGVDEED